MKKIGLTQGKFAFVDDKDYEWLNGYKWCFDTGYASTRRNKIRFRMHTLIMCPKGLEVDHIDGNRLNNQRKNLRIVTHQQNLQNQKTQKNKSSIYKGVSWHKTYKCWRAYIKFYQKYLFIGVFQKELWAAMAYDIFAKELFGEYAKLNFPN